MGSNEKYNTSWSLLEFIHPYESSNVDQNLVCLNKLCNSCDFSFIRMQNSMRMNEFSSSYDNIQHITGGRKLKMKITNRFLNFQFFFFFPKNYQSLFYFWKISSNRAKLNIRCLKTRILSFFAKFES